MYRILLVEDDKTVREGLEFFLAQEYFSVASAKDVSSAEELLDKQSFDLIILDINLGSFAASGFDLAKSLRERNIPTPIIFLTARDDERDVVRGFELGAADYVLKPFRSRELLARIRRLLPAEDSVEKIIETSGAELTLMERKIFMKLVEAKGSVVSREVLLDEFYAASGSFVNDNTVTVYIKRLREKLGSLGDRIKTVRNLGYKYVA